MKRTDWKKIKHEFETSNIRLKDLANKYHVKVGTLRSHKSRNHWSRGSKSPHKGVATKSNNATLHNPVATEINVKELQKSGLTVKQQNFCLRYLQCYNATKAYKLAYGVSYGVAKSIGYRLLENDGVQRELTRLRQHQINKLHFNRFDVLKKLIAIYNVDPGDYVHLGHETDVDEDGNKFERPYLYFRNQKDMDTSLVDEIKMGQNGPDVKVAPKLQVAKLLMHYLSDPINRNVKDDTLVKAFLQGQKKYQNKSDNSTDSDSKSSNNDKNQ